MTKGGHANNIKKRLSRLKRFRVKTWMLLLLLLPIVAGIITLLRTNHIKMTELRDAVLAADVNESDEEIYNTLVNLKEYVFHEVIINVIEENGVQRISFGTGPFYLEHQYLRAANAALAAAEASLTSDENPNGNVYAMASDTCRPQAIANGWTWNSAGYINCMMTEINKYPAMDEIQDQIIAALPSTELYRHNYSSPIWAPTLTGWLILVALILVIVLVVRFCFWLFLRLSLLFI